MRTEKSTLSFAARNCRYFVFAFFAIILFLNQTATAQSGRKPAQTAPSEPTAAAKSETDTQENKKTESISAIKVTGEIQYETGKHYSNYLNRALNECVETLKGRPVRPLEVTKAGKMKLNDAKEFAKKEPEAHVLWMGFFVKSYLAGLDVIQYVDYIDYAVMKPNTGKVLTYGRIELGKPNMGNAGTVLQIPSTRRRSTELSQLRQGANEIATILKRGGWLD